MNDITYRESVSLNQPNLSLKEALTLGSMGLTGEAGEVSEMIKKNVFYDKPIDKTKMVEEMGDLLWYFTHLLITFDLSMKEVEQANMDKLSKRFPNGFSKTDAIEQKDKK